MVDGMTTKLSANSVIEAKALALRMAVVYAQTRKEANILIESDATVVVSAIESHNTSLTWTTCKVIRDIRTIVGNNPTIRINSIRLTINQATD